MTPPSWGHEFIGEIVGHGPGGSENFPLGARMTSMPLLLGAGQPHVTGRDPDARVRSGS